MWQDDPMIYAVPVFFFLIIIELIVNYNQKRELYNSKDTLANIAMIAGASIVATGVKVIAFMLFVFIHQFAIFDIGYQWWAWVILLFADDLTFYVHHRLSHEVRILWAAHINHHSSEKLNFSTALRQSWTELLYKYFFWLWLPLIGFEPLMIMLMMSISMIYQFWPHTQLVGKLGSLEWLFNTPSHHRVHHASNIRYLDRNHGGILIIWDRLFNTFSEEREIEQPIFGITNNIHTYNPINIAFHEFKNLWADLKKAPDFETKLKYIFNPPGWSHDGPNKTANYLRKQSSLNTSNNV